MKQNEKRRSGEDLGEEDVKSVGEEEDALWVEALGVIEARLELLAQPKPLLAPP